MHASIRAIEYYLPRKALTAEELALRFPEWSVERIIRKIGIRTRYIAEESECASDLASIAAEQIFQSKACSPRDIDFLIFCTQSPDFAIPTTACLLQHRLSIPRSAGSFDYNLGCSGFVYGLGIAEGLISTGQAKTVLLLTGETYSKYLNEDDKSTRTLFGDGAAATLITTLDQQRASFGPFVYGTDGSGGDDLIVPGSGARGPARTVGVAGNGETTMERRSMCLQMNGNRIFQFAASAIPNVVQQVLERSGLTMDDIDLFVFHQANAFILEEIRRILDIPISKMQITLEECGNTVSSTIPIALKHALNERRIQTGALVMLVGFGVGYSWAATIVRWV